MTASCHQRAVRCMIRITIRVVRVGEVCILHMILQRILIHFIKLWPINLNRAHFSIDNFIFPQYI